MNRCEIHINGTCYEYKEGQTILEVATANGIEIPTLCYLKETKPFTSCFICVVEIKGRPNLVPACSTLVSPMMEISTESPRIFETRKACLELLMSDHCGDCLAPCQAACPAGCDIPGFIHLLLDNKPFEALQLIKETIPLPASLGRVCPKPCETACRRQLLESPVSICFLKRYISDVDIKTGKKFVPSVPESTGKKVAIIGGGPGGLSAAFYLRKSGHEVTIFDAHHRSGGMLRYGIPAYRLPRDVLDEEIDAIAQMGTNFVQDAVYGRDFDLDSLKQNGFDAVFVAVGAQVASSMDVPGEDEGGALSGIAFLDDAARGANIEVGNRVVVVGGGNTAIDAARTSLRLGAKEVIVLYRRTRKEMPANDIEIVEAEKEGVDFRYLSAPTAMERTNTGIKLTCIKMELGEPDASGRRRPVPVKGSEYSLEASTVISAIGQKVDTSNYDMKNFSLTRWNTFNVNPETFETNVSGVFAGGDCVSGADIAVRAIAAGKKVAYAIDKFLMTGKPVGEPHDFDAKMGELDEVPKDIFEGKARAERAHMPEMEAKTRIQGFEEVELGFDYDTALAEARRCLECGCGSAGECTVRKLATQYKVEPEKFKGDRRRFYTDESHPDIMFESHKCILCGNCVRFMKEVKKKDYFGFINRGFDTEIRPPVGKKMADLNFKGCLDVADVCPSGALSLKGRFKNLNN